MHEKKQVLPTPFENESYSFPRDVVWWFWCWWERYGEPRKGKIILTFSSLSLFSEICISVFLRVWVWWALQMRRWCIWSRGGVPSCILHPMHHPHPTSYTECTKEDIIILLSFLHYWNASLSRPTEPMHHFKHRLIPASPLADTSYHFINQPPPTIRTEKSAPGSDTLGCLHEFNLHSLFVAISDLLLQLNFMIAF